MPRLTNLNDVLFPVEEHPVFAGISDPGGEVRVAVPDILGASTANEMVLEGRTAGGLRFICVTSEKNIACRA